MGHEQLVELIGRKNLRLQRLVSRRSTWISPEQQSPWGAHRQRPGRTWSQDVRLYVPQSRWRTEVSTAPTDEISARFVHTEDATTIRSA